MSRHAANPFDSRSVPWGECASEWKKSGKNFAVVGTLTFSMLLSHDTAAPHMHTQPPTAGSSFTCGLKTTAPLRYQSIFAKKREREKKKKKNSFAFKLARVCHIRTRTKTTLSMRSPVTKAALLRECRSTMCLRLKSESHAVARRAVCARGREKPKRLAVRGRCSTGVPVHADAGYSLVLGNIRAHHRKRALARIYRAATCDAATVSPQYYITTNAVVLR